MRKKVTAVKVDTITYKRPHNGLPTWVRDNASTRGYADALEPISLYVTDKDIDNAFDCIGRGDGTKCVMAQAGKRLGAKAVYFYRTTAWVDFGEGPIVRFTTSRTIYNNIIDPFDRGDRDGVTGGVYPLTPPCNSQSIRRRQVLRKKTGRKITPKNKNAKKQVVAHTERVVMASRT